MSKSLRLWGLLFLLAESMSLVAQPTAYRHEFTAAQAIEYASKNNLQVRNALRAIQSQEQTNREVTAAALPNIGFGMGTTYNPNVAVQTLPNFISPATYGVLIAEGVRDGNGNPITMPGDFGFIQAQFGTRYNANAGLSLQQLLFDGQVFVGLQARRAAIDFQTKGAEFTETTIKQNVYKIYYQLVASRTQVGLLDANIERIQKLSNDYKSLYKNGFAEKIDLDKVEVQLTNLQTEKLKVTNAIEMGYLGLKTLMGMPIRDTLVLTEELTYEKINDFAATAEGFQYTDRKDFQYLSLARDLNAYNVKRYKLTYLPTLALGANYSKIAQRNQFNFFGKGDWFTVSNISLNMSVPLFTGFARDARVKKAEIDLKQVDDQLLDLKRQIDNSIEQASMKYRTATATLSIQKKNMELAERVFHQTKKKYEVGTGSNTEIYAADVDLKTAQTNYLNALYDAIVARVDFLFATGKL